MANEGITALRIVGLTSLDEAYELAGIEGSLQDQDDLRAKVNTFLGSPHTFDDVAMIPGPALSESISQQANKAASFNLRVVSRIYKFQEICNQKSKSTPGTVLSLTQRPPGTTSIQFPPPLGMAISAPNVSGLKMDVLVNPVNKSNLNKLTDIEVSDMFEKYSSSMGAAPAQDCEPTSEQLSAVNQLIQGGEAPYVDFSIFGPYGRRFLKKLSISTSHFVPELGSWKTTEQPGPPDFQSWWKSWNVFKTTMLLLGAAKPAQLDSYAEHIRKQIEDYGQTCWSIVYQADVRMRSEEFDRIRRRLSIAFFKLDQSSRTLSTFQPTDPWNTIFQEAHPDSSHSSDRFWQVEIKDKCNAFLTHVRSWAQVMDDGTHGLSSGNNGTFPGGKRYKQSGKSQGKGWPADKKMERWNHDKKSPDSDVYLSKDKSGFEICNNYNSGKCQLPCPSSRAHVCKSCGLPGHAFTSCPGKLKKGKDANTKGRSKGTKTKTKKGKVTEAK
jgi:hypothetical protein